MPEPLTKEERERRVADATGCPDEELTWVEREFLRYEATVAALEAQLAEASRLAEVGKAVEGMPDGWALRKVRGKFYAGSLTTQGVHGAVKHTAREAMEDAMGRAAETLAATPLDTSGVAASEGGDDYPCLEDEADVPEEAEDVARDEWLRGTRE